MHLSLFDWLIIIAYLFISLAVGLYFRKKASRSITDFFLGGRSFPWYLAGISMVATTFAADTPLAVTELVAKNGISGNWLWWNMLIGGMLTVFFFSRLWRRAEILTEPEFIELRYGGRPAALLRGFKAVHLGFFMNCLIIGWVNLAMVTVIEVFFELPHFTAILLVAGIMALTAFYSALSGLWGVAVTDAIQFIIAMTGCIVLAVIVVNSDAVGGIEGLKEKLPERTFSFFPSFSTGDGISDLGNSLTLGIGSFLAYMCIWWSSWYPGNEPGGGGYVAQRIMSTKNEKHALLSTLLFQVANYCLRPWPWILVGLCTLVLYPGLPDEEKRLGYVYAMRDFLPAGLKGLMLVAFLAAYMSTLSTQLNWGTSYLVNDLYKRFIVPPGTIRIPVEEMKHYVTAGKMITIGLMVVSLFVTLLIETISGVWQFIIECGAGLGLVLILRWYWWRINAWSEIGATIFPFFYYAFSKFILGLEFPVSFFFTVGLTTVSWLILTYATAPEAPAVLKNFYQRVKPGGFWKKIPKALLNESPPDPFTFRDLFICWISATAMTYSILFMTGDIILKNLYSSIVWGLVAAVSFTILYRKTARLL
ncbi:MAG: Na+:solute symporter [Bacteroidetes bacterium]|nr:Na+:solute symporter [Bacteroidota bacterium]